MYKHNILSVLLPVMGTQLIISSIGRQFKTIEQKNMNFRFISLIEIIVAFVSLLSAIGFVLVGFGIYALVFSSLIAALFSSIIYLLVGLKKYRIKIHFSFLETRPFLKIGAFHTGGQVLNFLNKEIDILIVGGVLGTETLGMYNLAKRLVYNPFRMISPILSKVATPLFATIQENKKGLGRAFLKLNSIVSSINLPIYIVFIVFASPITTLIYGDNYKEIIPLVQILSLYTYSISIRNPLGTITIASGRTDLELTITSISILVVPMVVLISSYFSVKIMCIAITITSFLFLFPIWRFVVKNIIDVSFIKYIKGFIPNYPLLISSIRQLV